MTETVVVMAALYLASLAGLGVLTKARDASDETSRLPQMLGSLALLTAVGALRLHITHLGGTNDALIAGTVLNLSIIVGTGFDPMNAVVAWPGVSKEAAKRRVVKNLRRSTHPTRERSTSAKYPLLIFFLFAVVFAIRIGTH